MKNLLSFCTLLATLMVVVSANKTATREKGNDFEIYHVEKVTLPSSRGNVASKHEEKSVQPITQNSVYFTSGFNSGKFIPEEESIPDEPETDDDEDENDDKEDDNDLIIQTGTTMKPKGINGHKNSTVNVNTISEFDASQLPEEYSELNLKDKIIYATVSRIYSAIFKNIIQKLVEAKMSDSFTMDKDVLAAFKRIKKGRAVLKKDLNNAKSSISSTSDYLLIIGASAAGKMTAKPHYYMALIDSIPLGESLRSDEKAEKLTYRLTSLMPITVARLHK